MDFLSNLLLSAAALGAGVYCFVLSRRLRALASLEGGMGSAIAVLSSQVDELSKSLKAAQELAGATNHLLGERTTKAEAVADKLELLVASLHDLPDEAPAAPVKSLKEPTPWPRDQVPRPQVPEPAQATQPPRARILRRRPQQGSNG